MHKLNLNCKPRPIEDDKQYGIQYQSIFSQLLCNIRDAFQTYTLNNDFIEHPIEKKICIKMHRVSVVLLCKLQQPLAR